MNASTLQAAFVVGAASGGPFNTPVPGTVTYDATNDIATFTPTGGVFPPNVQIFVAVSGAVSMSGLPMAQEYDFSFTTGAGPDTTPPVVLSTNPAAGATSVGTNQTIVATFDKGMDSTTLTGATFVVTGPGATMVGGTVTYSTIGSTATFTPSSVLLIDTTYTATITTGVKDLAGNALANNFVWTFMTGAGTDSTAPTVTSTNPALAAPSVGIDASVNATFSKAMNSSTLNAATFTVTGPGATVVSGKVSYDVADNIVTFTPTSALAASTTFTATITTGALDLAGNALASNFVWTFTTGTTATGLLPVDLGAAAGFEVFAQATVTNTGFTVVNGDLGLTPNTITSVTGFPPGIVNGTIYTAGDPQATAALSSLNAAYLDAAGRSLPASVNENLAGLTVFPGLYKNAAGSFEITGGTLTLDAQGDPDAIWIFQMASTLTLTTPNCNVILANGAQASNIFWQVGSSATVGVGCVLEGSILADTSITLATGATVNGRSLAGAVVSSGAVTMDSNKASLPACN